MPNFKRRIGHREGLFCICPKILLKCKKIIRFWAYGNGFLYVPTLLANIVGIYENSNAYAQKYGWRRGFRVNFGHFLKMAFHMPKSVARERILEGFLEQNLSVFLK